MPEAALGPFARALSHLPPRAGRPAGSLAGRVRAKEPAARPPRGQTEPLAAHPPAAVSARLWAGGSASGRGRGGPLSELTELPQPGAEGHSSSWGQTLLPGNCWQPGLGSEPPHLTSSEVRTQRDPGHGQGTAGDPEGVSLTCGTPGGSACPSSGHVGRRKCSG